MMEYREPESFLIEARKHVIFDVRTPAEYAQGHIPDALNLPLFTNEERAEVGTLYTRSGKQPAVLRGLQFVGPRMNEMARAALREARKHDTDTVYLHCWRGGMRSASVGWLLEQVGLHCVVLQGGYKAYRAAGRERMSHYELRILGGRTGCGKTEILHRMAQNGIQTIDLEGLAHHKGSAFGALGESEQPTVEQFENDLTEKLRALDPKKTLWVEGESANIGRVSLPQEFYAAMKRAPVVLIDLPFDQRAQRLDAQYGAFPVEEILNSLERIRKRLGGDRYAEAVAALQNGNRLLAVEIALRYYDKYYLYEIEGRDPSLITRLNFEQFDLDSLCAAVVAADSNSSTSKG